MFIIPICLNVLFMSINVFIRNDQFNYLNEIQCISYYECIILKCKYFFFFFFKCLPNIADVYILFVQMLNILIE